MDRYELENRRRSLAMIATGQPSGLTREQAITLIEELQVARAELAQLRAELDAGMGHPARPDDQLRFPLPLGT
jgi:hypothetical protein